MSEEIEKPVHQILYRQSSLETRLSPIHLSEESDSESSDADENKDEQLQIVKNRLSKNIHIGTSMANEEKNKFQQELQNVLNKGCKKDKKGSTSTKSIDPILDCESKDINKEQKNKVQRQKYATSKPNIPKKPKMQQTFRVPEDTDKSENDLCELENSSVGLLKENRLPPAHSEESDSKSHDGCKNKDAHLKVVEKRGPENINNGASIANPKHKFQLELQSVLNKGCKNNSIRTTDINYCEENNKYNTGSTSSTSIDPLLNCESEDAIKEQKNQDERQATSKPIVPKKPKTQETFSILEDAGKSENYLCDLGSSSVGLLKALNVTKNKKEEMATARPKSPRPVAIKGEKDESIWDKLGTLGRKKRIKEVQEVQAEGKYAIDSPGCPTAPIIPPEEYNLDDNEERCIIDPRAYEDPKFKELLNVLQEWINDELASQRIIVQDLSEDLYDGQVLQKLLEKLTGDKLDVPEVTQSEEGQKQKLSVVLDHFNKVLGIQRISHNKWSVEAIHSKNIVAITHLLVALARHFRPPVRLPEHVSVAVVVVQKIRGVLNHKVVSESLTKVYDDVGMRCERDAFDTLFDHAPDKLQVVKKSLVTFVNKHLNKMNFEVTEIESQFHDGVYLIMLMGLLEGFFVPHYSFHLTPHEFDQKVHNVNFAFELMEEVGLQRPKARPEDVVNMDLKSTLRVLYNLFLKYKMIL